MSSGRSTRDCNVDPIAGIAIDGFVAVLGARKRAAGGEDKKRRVEARTALPYASNFNLPVKASDSPVVVRFEF